MNVTYKAKLACKTTVVYKAEVKVAFKARVALKEWVAYKAKVKSACKEGKGGA